MPFNNMNLFLSLAVLQNKGIPKDKMFAASVGAALVPGLLGLAVPLIVANNAGASTTTGGGKGTGTGAGTGTSTGTDTGSTTTLTRVPDVQGKQEQDAIDVITAAGLNPVVNHAYFNSGAGGRAPDKGLVAFQDPKPSSDWVDTGTDVTIEVSLGEAPAAAVDSVALDKTILAIDQDLQKKVADVGGKVDQILSKMDKLDKGGGAAASKH